MSNTAVLLVLISLLFLSNKITLINSLCPFYFPNDISFKPIISEDHEIKDVHFLYKNRPVKLMFLINPKIVDLKKKKDAIFFSLSELKQISTELNNTYLFDLPMKINKGTFNAKCFVSAKTLNCSLKSKVGKIKKFSVKNTYHFIQNTDILLITKITAPKSLFVKSYFNYYFINSHQDSIDYIDFSALKPTQKKEKTIKTHLNFLTNLLKRNKIPYWLTYGTLLGMIRNKDIIPGDIDFDIGAHSNSAETMLELNNEIRDKGYEFIWRYNKDDMKVRVNMTAPNNTKMFLKLNYNNKTVGDIFLYHPLKDGNFRVYEPLHKILTFQNSLIFAYQIENLEEIKVENEVYSVPNFANCTLRFIYGDMWIYPMRLIDQEIKESQFDIFHHEKKPDIKGYEECIKDNLVKEIGRDYEKFVGEIKAKIEEDEVVAMENFEITKEILEMYDIKF